MGFRIFINVALIIGGLFVIVGMIQGEIVQGKEVDVNVTYIDRLRDISFTAFDREVNLGYFGLDKVMIKETMKYIKRGEERKKNIAAALKGIAEDQDAIQAFCGLNSEIRPRYAVAPYLIKEENGRRKALNVRRVKKVEYQDWAQNLYLKDIYAKFELRADPKVDTTKMFYGAIFLKKDEDLLQEISPWGNGPSSWKWKGVLRLAKDEQVKLNEIMAEYFALMLLFIETAQESGGVCIKN
jgi:hypothetical protein